MTVVGYYRTRWTIERFHYVLKSGCEIEGIHTNPTLKHLQSQTESAILYMVMTMRSRKDFSVSQWKEIKFKYCVKGKKKIKDVKAYKRLQVLYMRGLGKTNREISEVTGFHIQYITDLVRKYMDHGMDAILSDKRTSNNRRMSFDEESSFLEQFVDLADAGQIITIDKILQKFEEATEKSSNSSTIYRLLKRHGWRKVKPRPQHPGKASDEDIEASKKLRQNTRSCWKIITETERLG